MLPTSENLVNQVQKIIFIFFFFKTISHLTRHLNRILQLFAIIYLSKEEMCIWGGGEGGGPGQLALIGEEGGGGEIPWPGQLAPSGEENLA